MVFRSLSGISDFAYVSGYIFIGRLLIQSKFLFYTNFDSSHSTLDILRYG